MCRKNALNYWGVCIIGAVLLVGLAASAPVLGEVTQTQHEPLSLTTSHGIKVSVVGDQVHIESPIPVVISVKVLAPPPGAEPAPTPLGAKSPLSRRWPVMVAPTP